MFKPNNPYLNTHSHSKISYNYKQNSHLRFLARIWFKKIRWQISDLGYSVWFFWHNFTFFNHQLDQYITLIVQREYTWHMHRNYNAIAKLESPMLKKNFQRRESKHWCTLHGPNMQTCLEYQCGSSPNHAEYFDLIICNYSYVPIKHGYSDFIICNSSYILKRKFPSVNLWCTI